MNMNKFVYISSVSDNDLPHELKRQIIDDTKFIVWASINRQIHFVGRTTTRKQAEKLYKQEKAK